MPTNETNPINWAYVYRCDVLRNINVHHTQMVNYIHEASMDSAALEQVRIAQYAEAVSNARRALDRVLDLQEKHITNAYVERENDTLNDELRNLGL